MTKVIGVLQEKGGVAKTMTAENLGHALVREGHRVLLVDFDPQAPTHRRLGAVVPEERVLLETALKAQNLTQSVYPTRIPNLDVIPGDRTADPVRFTDQRLPDLLFRKALASLESRNYSFVIGDSKGTLDLMTSLVAFAADTVLIPVEPDMDCVFSTNTTAAWLDAILRDRPEVEERSRFVHLVATKVDSGTKLARWLLSMLSEMNCPLCETVIWKNQAFPNARGDGQTIFEYLEANPRDKYAQAGAEVFTKLANEVMSYVETPESSRQRLAANQ